MNASSACLLPSVVRRVDQWLRSPEAYSPAVTDVTVIETHISWLFLTDKYAYKLKKPVHFDFLDFRDCEQRRHACQEEVRLNRRLAKGVYLGVLAITDEGDTFAFDGSGPVVDWVVKMRRLRADRAMDQLIRAGHLSDAEVREVAGVLAEFYLQAPPVSLRCEEYLAALERHVLGNHVELSDDSHGLSQAAVRRVFHAQRRVLRLWPELLSTRVCDGRIIDGHGDLRPEHIYLVPAPTIIDCIEFNEEFRRLDVLDELCFLDVECMQLGAPWVGARILAHYEELCRDVPPETLVAFYRCYRACVRAKVSALRAEQLTGDEREAARRQSASYLALADRYAATYAKPLLLVVCGLTGTGKSTLAEALASELGMASMETDMVRRELFGWHAEGADFEQGRYSRDKRQRVYAEMLSRAGERLATGESLLLDGTFLDPEQRVAAARVADNHHAELRFVHCTCPERVVVERIAARQSVGTSRSEATPEIFRQQQRAANWDFGPLAWTRIETTACLPDMLEQVFTSLRHSI